MMEKIYLWFVLCLDGSACTSVEVYQLDSFTGPAAMADCKREEKKRYRQMAHGKQTFLMGCKTENEFNRVGTGK